jgi:hypothetical protein
MNDLSQAHRIFLFPLRQTQGEQKILKLCDRLRTVLLLDAQFLPIAGSVQHQ